MVIDQGVTLTLDPGTSVFCSSGSKIIVKGTIIVAGTAIDPVFIGSNNPFQRFSPNWHGIIINQPAVNSSSFQYCRISGAESGIGIIQPGIISTVSLDFVEIDGCSFGLYLTGVFGTTVNHSAIHNCGTGLFIDSGANVTLANCSIFSCNEDGIYIHSSSLSLQDVKVNHNSGLGLNAINTLNVEIRDCEFKFNGAAHSLGAGVYLSGSSPTFYNTTISNNGGYGVFVSASSFPCFYDVLQPFDGYNTMEDNGGDEMQYVEGMAFLENCLNNFIDDGGGVLLRTSNSVHFPNEDKVKLNYWGNILGPQFGQLQPIGFFNFIPYCGELNEVDDNEEDELRDLFNNSLRAEIEGDSTVAFRGFRALMSDHANTAYASSAAIRYANMAVSISKDFENPSHFLNSNRGYLLRLLNDCENDNFVRAIQVSARICLAALADWDSLFDELSDFMENDPGERDSIFALIENDAYLIQRQQDPQFQGNEIQSLGKNYLEFSNYLKKLDKNLELLIQSEKNYPKNTIPEEFFFNSNYPNPFNSTTSIEYGLKEDIQVSLKIYDIGGRLVKQLVNGYQKAGYYKTYWDGRNSKGQEVSSGIYFYRVQRGSFIQTHKMTLLK